MMAENWHKFLPNSTLSTMIPCKNADINFYVNWDIFNQKTNIDVGWFTHCEDDINKKINFNQKASQMDYCLCPAKNTFKLLPKEKSYILKHGVGEEYINKKKKIKFGIIGRDYGSGRKNFSIIEKLKKIPNSSFTISEGKLSKEDIINLYNEIDYLLVTSNNKVGPVPVIEAFTLGVPVIAPNVGWCWEYPVIKYDCYEDLYILKNQLYSFVDVNRIWENSSKELKNIFEKLYKNN